MSANGETGSVPRLGRATIRDVASLAGVSHSAVSKVIRNAYGVSPRMRERVTAAIDELGYRPSATARAMRGSGFTIGFEMPSDDNPFMNVLIGGATRALVESPYQLIVAPATVDSALESRALEALVDREVDGLIAISPLVDREWLARLARTTPLVLIGRHEASPAYDNVTSDDVAGSRLVLEHLVSLGHRRIAHLTREDFVTVPESGTPHAIRLAAYLDFMAAAGLEPMVIRTGPTEEDARDATTELVSGPDRPTAMFVGNDSLAIGVQRAILDAGLDHGDVSLAAYDDIPIASHPAVSLTTIDQRGADLGALAAELLLERLAGRTESRQVEVPPVLRVRSSTRPPRAAS